MGAKLLLIEDDAQTVELLVTRLRAAGYEVDVAQDAMMGLQAVRKSPPDLILLDLKIPAGGGVAILEGLKKAFLMIPVIVLTGTTDPAQKKRLLEFGIKTYLQKPFQPEELMRTIAEALPK